MTACAAEIAGGHPAVASLALALGCTLFVGWTLGRIGDFSRPSTRSDTTELVIPFRPLWIAAGLLIAGLFVGVVGPVAFQAR